MLDTTVLVYVHGTDHELRGPCRDLIHAIGEGSLRATTTVEVIQEFLHVRSRGRDRRSATRDARSFIELLTPLLPVDESTLRHGLDLFGSSPELGAFDSVLAAAALASGARALVSADRAFGAVPGLLHVAPTDDGVAALLSGSS